MLEILLLYISRIVITTSAIETLMNKMYNTTIAPVVSYASET
jgi:hypothetical protein